ELANARASGAALKDANAQAVAASQALQIELDAALAAEAKAHQHAESAEAERARQADMWRQHAVTFLSLSFARLMVVYQNLANGSGTIDSVLNAVLDALASEFSRVALFKVKHNRLEGVRQTGFEFPPDMSHVLIPRTID